MTDLVPLSLAALPEPWTLTARSARQQAAGASEDSAARAVAALSALLAALPDVPEPTEADLPEEFADYFPFTADWLAERMPTLAEISSDTIAAMLAERTAVPVADVPAAPVVALGRLWVRTLVVELIQECLALLTDTPPGRAADARLASALSPSVRAALAELAARELLRQPAYVGSALLSALAGMGSPADRLLDEVAGGGATGGGATGGGARWERLDPELRRHARSLQVWRASLARAEETPR